VNLPEAPLESRTGGENPVRGVTRHDSPGEKKLRQMPGKPRNGPPRAFWGIWGEVRGSLQCNFVVVFLTYAKPRRSENATYSLRLQVGPCITSRNASGAGVQP
jgi:hypothetical protein